MRRSKGCIRLYSRPIFKAAGLDPGSVRVYLIRNDKINAFVAGGQRMFIHTGLLMRTKTPNEVIGVIAHETGHIAGGHLARMGLEVDKASTQAIIGALIGVAAAVGGGASGNEQVARAGSGIMMGSQSLAQRGLLSYQRDMESSADQAAIRYLTATKQSPRGMLNLFQVLANESLASTVGADPYVSRIRCRLPASAISSLRHANPLTSMPRIRRSCACGMRSCRRSSRASCHLRSRSTTAILQATRARLPAMPARLPHSAAATRPSLPRSSTASSGPFPKNPYFYELKGQALLDGGQARAALAPLAQANKLLPNNGLLQMLEAQALIATGGDARRHGAPSRS